MSPPRVSLNIQAVWDRAAETEESVTLGKNQEAQETGQPPKLHTGHHYPGRNEHKSQAL